MTTTLRPLTAEQPTPDGGTGRLFAICVNGRPVGRVTATVRATPGPRVGEITALGVDPGERGRGRGTVAVLAAEEVLRGWGCAGAEIEISEGPAVPDPAAALRFAETLGYTVRARNMVKELPDALPELPPGATARPMSAAEFPEWIAAVSAGYVEHLVGSGITPERARAQSEADHRRVLPLGADSPHTVLRVLRTPQGRVGTLWVNTDAGLSPDDLPLAWVFYVEADAAHRGEGHGRSLMLLAERECLDLGIRRLALNVFAGNAPANALYRSLGYRTYRQFLFKAL
jgi:GNAT superfamily N-acetyltransferase